MAVAHLVNFLIFMVVRCQGNRLDQLESSLMSTKAELESTRKLLVTLADEVQNNRVRLANAENCLNTKSKRQQVIASRTGAVAFHTKAMAHQTSLSQHQVILFHKVDVNDGRGYSNSTGVFTCPISGMYFFTMTIMTDPGRQVETELVKNHDSLMIVYSGATNNHWNTGTNSVVVHLREGDRLWVQVLQNYVNDGTNIVHGDGWTTWTGFLLNEEE